MASELSAAYGTGYDASVNVIPGCRDGKCIPF